MKQLVLLGSGPSHLQVLKELAQAPLPGVQVTLVAAGPREVFAGMLPGWVAGRYTLDDCVVPLAPLAQAAQVTLIEGTPATLAASERRLQLTDGQTLHYDALSLDTEPEMDRGAIPGAREHASFVRPVEAFIRSWEALRELAEQRTLSVVVIGSGVAAVEFAFAVQERLASRVRVALVTGGGTLLPAHARALRARVKLRLQRNKIPLFEDRCAVITASQAQLEQGLRLGCDASVMALDEAGHVPPRATLRSLAQARAFVAGGELVAVRSQRSAWHLVACGAQSGIAGWGPLALEGRWVSALKERRDREQIGRYKLG